MLLHSPMDKSLPRHAFPERMRILQLIVVSFLMLQINISRPARPLLQFKIHAIWDLWVK